jgi:hypothetical protein
VRSGGPTLFRVPGTRIDDYPRKLVAWRFKDVSRFAADDARRVEIALRDAAGGELLLTATRGEDGEWSSAPEAIDPDRIRTLVDELARLRARDILAESMGPEELRGLALDPPNASFVVRGEDAGSALAEVRIGVLRQGGGVVAQAAGNPTVFELDPVLAEYLPLSLDALRARFVEKPDESPAKAESSAEEGEAPEPSAEAEPPEAAEESP